MANEQQSATFVTTDKHLIERGGSVISKTDAAVMASAVTGEGLTAVTPEELRELKRAGLATIRHFGKAFRRMTKDQAVFVRELRVDRSHTWRAVAGECARRWGGNWEDNQLAGMAICERAARLLGEDFQKEPWN